MRDLVVFCADVGSLKSGHFGWARSPSGEAPVVDHDSSKPADLADAVLDELLAGRPVALGFECSLFVPVPTRWNSAPPAAVKVIALGPRVLGPVP